MTLPWTRLYDSAYSLLSINCAVSTALEWCNHYMLFVYYKLNSTTTTTITNTNKNNTNNVLLCSSEYMSANYCSWRAVCFSLSKGILTHCLRYCSYLLRCETIWGLYYNKPGFHLEINILHWTFCLGLFSNPSHWGNISVFDQAIGSILYYFDNSTL